jgi:hypothetical protein
MSTSLPSPSTAPTTATSDAPPGTASPPRRLGLAAGIWSLLVAVTGAIWLIAPDSYPDQLTPDGDGGALTELVEPGVVSSILVALGVGGIALAVALARGGGRARGVTSVAAAYAVVFGLLLTDLSLLVTFGYGIALLGPPVALVAIAALAVRRTGARWLLAGLLAAIVVVVALLDLDGAVGSGFLEGLGDGLRRSGSRMLANLASFAGGVLWGLLALRSAGVRWWGDRPATTSYVAPRRDWGWWATIVAAAGPLGYVLIRMTWLTPWPIGPAADELDSDPALRLFGLFLGFAAIGGSVLTLGLLARWGTVYPRWLPVVGGRPVSPTWPTVTAIVVGVAITVAGRSMVQMLLVERDYEGFLVLLLMPFPIWGPALILAAIAYHRRRHTAPTPG